MKTTDFAYYVGKYLNLYLPRQRAYSPKTCEEYGRVFSLFIEFLETEENIKILKFRLESFNKEIVESFLNYLEVTRGCCNKTINQRLSVLHSFCSYVIYSNPSQIYSIQRILEVPFRKQKDKIMPYTSPEGIKLILKQIPSNNKIGIRDLAMFSFLYDTGCRVSEVCDMKVKNLNLSSSPYAIIEGKGGKSRIVPLQENQIKILKTYINLYKLNLPENNENSLFPNQYGAKMSRQSVSRALKKYVTEAKIKRPDLIPESFSCHSVRHSAAMALLEANIDLIYIRDFLGHSSVKTTELYLRKSPDHIAKETKAILDVAHSSKIKKNWKNTKVTDWLKSFEY
jgi:site-specific recombinase XerD